MATAIWYHSTAGQDATPVLFEIFDEREYPIVVHSPASFDCLSQTIGVLFRLRLTFVWLRCVSCYGELRRVPWM